MVSAATTWPCRHPRPRTSIRGWPPAGTARSTLSGWRSTTPARPRSAPSSATPARATVAPAGPRPPLYTTPPATARPAPWVASTSRWWRVGPDVGGSRRRPAGEVVYVGYSSTVRDGMRVVASRDGGTTWSSSVTATPGIYGDLEVDATGAVHAVALDGGPGRRPDLGRQQGLVRGLARRRHVVLTAHRRVPPGRAAAVLLLQPQRQRRHPAQADLRGVPARQRRRRVGHRAGDVGRRRPGPGAIPPSTTTATAPATCCRRWSSTRRPARSTSPGTTSAMAPARWRTRSVAVAAPPAARTSYQRPWMRRMKSYG
jgi:hypothetical protein